MGIDLKDLVDFVDKDIRDAIRKGLLPENPTDKEMNDYLSALFDRRNSRNDNQ